jgi:hypothetical protein
MNKRLSNKLKDQFRDNKLIARKSCFYCINWGFGCANGHPNVYPGDNSDYLYGCKKRLDACKFLAKQLKNEKFALSGWQLTEIPAHYVYVFENKKKHKDITIVYDEEKMCYQIYSTDMFWKYSKKYNMYKHDSIAEALKVPWQHWNFMMCAK